MAAGGWGRACLVEPQKEVRVNCGSKVEWLLLNQFLMATQLIYWTNVLPPNSFRICLKTSSPAVRMCSNNVFKMANMCWLQFPQLEQYPMKTGTGFHKSVKQCKRCREVRQLPHELWKGSLKIFFLGASLWEVVWPPNTCGYNTVYTKLWLVKDIQGLTELGLLRYMWLHGMVTGTWKRRGWNIGGYGRRGEVQL